MFLVPSVRIPALCVTLLVLLGACERVDVDALPEVPRVRFDTFLPGVQTQLTDAYAAVDAKPASAEANGALAMMLQTYKQFAAADVMYARTRVIEPANFDWAYLHGIVLGAVGKPDEAVIALEHALTLTDAYPWAQIRLAELKAEQGDLLAAEALYDEVVRNAVPFSEAFFSHGKFLLDRGRVDQAIQAFKQTLRLSGNLGAAYYQLGLAYREKGLRDEAQKNFALAKKHQGYSADSSDSVLNKLLPLNLSDTPFVHRAKVLAESGRFDQAQRFIEMALERNPDSVAAHASMIGMAARQGNFALVDKHFDTAVAIAPRNAKIYFNLGVARIAEKRLVEAATAFEQSIDRDDTDPNAHVQLATLRHQSGRLRAAREHLQRALALEPGHQTANWLMGELVLDAGDASAAEAYLLKAVSDVHPMAAMMLAKLAEARLAGGDTDAATAALEQARAAQRTNAVPGLEARFEALARQIAAATADE
ncbi:MAG: tetratricopeptide repeat protein [Gammaproteobacteria bacterium]